MVFQQKSGIRGDLYVSNRQYPDVPMYQSFPSCCYFVTIMYIKTELSEHKPNKVPIAMATHSPALGAAKDTNLNILKQQKGGQKIIKLNYQSFDESERIRETF